MGMFGVRRPLRFLARQLDLDEDQVGKLAGVLDDLKTERAQAAVDDRRSRKLFTDALAGESFDAKVARDAAAQRVAAATRVQEAVVGALEAIHAILDEEQRERFNYLVRTGALEI